jgi:nucleoside-diphosphate-sugar epimerase
MRILVTGGAGFVGRRFCRALLEAKHEVVCVDNLVAMTGASDPRKGWWNFAPCDFQSFTFNHEDCREFFKRTREPFDEVYHLAAMVGGRVMIEQFPLAVADDLAIDASYWQWAKENQINKTIYFSSSAAYPISLQTQQNYRLLKEVDINFAQLIGVPDMTYGWAKLTGEYLAKLAYEKHGLKSVVYRPFSGYGEDQDLAYPFSAICLRALQLKSASTFNVWGSGLQMRDFIHIDDCVRGVLTTKDLINDASALNLSTGVFTSFISLAKQITACVGYGPDILGSSNTPEGVFARAGDTALQHHYGFKPKVSLPAGIMRSLHYLSGTNHVA